MSSTPVPPLGVDDAATVKLPPSCEYVRELAEAFQEQHAGERGDQEARLAELPEDADPTLRAVIELNVAGARRAEGAVQRRPHRRVGPVRAVMARMSAPNVPARSPKSCNTRTRPERPRTSRIRGASHRASAKSGSSGDNDPDPELAEPAAGDDADAESEPPARRLCLCGCGRDISHKNAGARTYDATCRSRVRRRRLAEKQAAAAELSGRKRWEQTLPRYQEIEHVQEAIGTGAVATDIGERLIAVLGGLRLKELGNTRCPCDDQSYHWIDPDGDAMCCKCGRWIAKVSAELNGFDIHEAAMLTDHKGRRLSRCFAKHRKHGVPSDDVMLRTRLPSHPPVPKYPERRRFEAVAS